MQPRKEENPVCGGLSKAAQERGGSFSSIFYKLCSPLGMDFYEGFTNFLCKGLSNVSLGETFELYYGATKAKGGVEMQSALERRQAMLELLSDRRQETVANLMAEFGVSRCTVLRDIETLSCSAPIFTVQGNGGGIRVAEGYYYGRRYLHSDEEALLRRLIHGLQPEEQKTMQGTSPLSPQSRNPKRMPPPVTRRRRCAFPAQKGGQAP